MELSEELPGPSRTVASSVKVCNPGGIDVLGNPALTLLQTCVAFFSNDPPKQGPVCNLRGCTFF